MFVPMSNAYELGMETGDREFALLCSAIPTWTKFEFQHLPDLHKELTCLRASMALHRQRTFDFVCRPIHQSIQNLIGLSDDPTRLRGNAYDEKIHQEATRENITQIVDWSYAHEAVICCFLGKYKHAIYLSHQCKVIKKPHTGIMGASVVSFYFGFADVAFAREQKKRRAWVAERYSRRLRQWGLHSPQNCFGKHLLLEAELAALHGHVSALSKYIAAIGALKEGRLIPLVALANERLAFYLRDMDDSDRAIPYFHEALTWYWKWGAWVKFDQLLTVVEGLGIFYNPTQ